VKPMRVYIDTSVFGGYFDDAFEGASRGFLLAIWDGRATALLSETLLRELEEAPQEVKDLLSRTLRGESERLEVTEETVELQDAYLTAGVVPRKYADDALHVALATIARAHVIVSWNFKHLVNPISIRAFNGVNLIQGYGPVVIMTPTDLIPILEGKDEEEKEI
jgi:predicted nucleic acid-binding protein